MSAGKRHVVALPSLGRTLVIIEPGPLSALRVELDGVALERKGWLRPIYSVPTGAGASVDVEVRWDAFRGGVEVRGPELSVHAGTPIPLPLAVLALLPFALAVVGGAIGGAIGAMAWLLNRQIAGLSWPLPARAVLMLGVTVVAGLGWAVAVTALQLAVR